MSQIIEDKDSAVGVENQEAMTKSEQSPVLETKEKHVRQKRDIPWREDKELLRQYHLKYYHEHLEVVVCECGKKVTKVKMRRHLGSTLHQRWLAKKQQMTMFL